MESPTSPAVGTPLSKETAAVGCVTKLESPCNVDEETTTEENSNSTAATVVSLCTEPAEADKSNSAVNQVTLLTNSLISH